MLGSKQSLYATFVLFVCGAAGSVASVLSDGSLVGSIASILGYCGAGFYARDYLVERDTNAD